MKRLVVLVSGNGSNLQAIIDSIEKQTLNAIIMAVICNKKNAYAMERAKNKHIPTIYHPFVKSQISRQEYDLKLSQIIQKLFPDLIVLAGWMHILSPIFLVNFPNIINLHPALPGMFPGKNAIEQAFTAYQKGNITYTGIMVHKVIPEIDAGQVIAKKKINIFKNDTLNDLKTRIQKYEKEVLIYSIQQILSQMNTPSTSSIDISNVKVGKVRNMHIINKELVAFVHTDRLSSFDRHICDIPGKGNLLNLISSWWLKQTQHIIPNHYIDSFDNILIAKRCQVILIEVVVRGYITGSTNTSLWTHYSNGVRNYCGIDFPDGLLKNQKLSQPVITPTTKDEHDELISATEIVNRNILSQEEWDFIADKATQLFKYGQMVADSRDLILVDTKYEFGRDTSGNIILIDEIHTCDSSRYWKKDTYLERFTNNLEPQKLDKDAIRDYLKTVCDPYTVETIPSIPEDRIQSVLKCYLDLYKSLTQNQITRLQTYSEQLDLNNTISQYFQKQYSNLVVIISGSTSDSKFVEKIQNELDILGIFNCYYVSSAHKNTRQVLEIIENYEKQNRNIIYITVAGRSNALSGVVAAQSSYPVIACPPFKDKMDMMVNINSSLQCPSKTPVMTILEPSNVASVCQRIFNFTKN